MIGCVQRGQSPFDLSSEAAYQHWRERKLEQAPKTITELIVEVEDAEIYPLQNMPRYLLAAAEPIWLFM